MDGFVMNVTKLFVKCKFFRNIGWFFCLFFFYKNLWSNINLLIEENKHENFILSDSAFDCGWVVFSKSVDHH